MNTIALLPSEEIIELVKSLITDEELDMISEIIRRQKTTDRDEPGMYIYHPVRRC